MLSIDKDVRCSQQSVCRSVASSGSGQMRGRKPALRTLQRQALAKQQAEQQQQLRQRSMLDTKSTTSNRTLPALTSLQSYHVSVIDYLILAGLVNFPTVL